jgi:WD40 repeat protein
MQGTTALLGSEGGDVHMYSLIDGSCELVIAGANEPVTCLSVAWNVSAALSSPIAAVGHMTGGILVWDLMGEPEDLPICELKGHRAGVTGLAFHSRGECLLSSSLDGTVIVWDMLSGTCMSTLLGHSAPVNGVLVCHLLVCPMHVIPECMDMWAWICGLPDCLQGLHCTLQGFASSTQGCLTW